MIEEAKCQTCRFWSPHGNGYGMCGVPLPPMSVLGNDASLIRGPCAGDYYCALHRPKSAKL